MAAYTVTSNKATPRNIAGMMAVPVSGFPESDLAA